MRRLRALRPLEVDERGLEVISFCGHCGTPPAASVEAAGSRVCGHCELGLVLQASSDIVPRAGEPFLVIDSHLIVCAVSEHAEGLLDTDETKAVNRHVSDFLVAADANAPRAENLLALLVHAASETGPPRTAVVRPRHEFGVRFLARIGPCGPPSAALLVLTD